VGCSRGVECVAHMSAQWSYGGAPRVAASPQGGNRSCFLFLGAEIIIVNAHGSKLKLHTILFDLRLSCL
jgi:hypothetical protein